MLINEYKDIEYVITNIKMNIIKYCKLIQNK